MNFMNDFAQKHPKAAEWVRKGGLAYTLANLTAIFFGECINFPLQRNVTFKSHGPLAPLRRGQQDFCSPMWGAKTGTR